MNFYHSLFFWIKFMEPPNLAKLEKVLNDKRPVSCRSMIPKFHEWLVPKSTTRWRFIKFSSQTCYQVMVNLVCERSKLNFCLKGILKWFSPKENSLVYATPKICQFLPHFELWFCKMILFGCWSFKFRWYIFCVKSLKIEHFNLKGLRLNMSLPNFRNKSL